MGALGPPPNTLFCRKRRPRRVLLRFTASCGFAARYSSDRGCGPVAIGEQPSGYLPFKEDPLPADGLVFSPSYIFPVEVLERGIMSRPRYLFQTVIVDGYDGRTLLIDERNVAPCFADFPPDGVPVERLPLKISAAAASFIAEAGALPPDCRSWRKAFKNRNIMLREESASLVWRVYAIKGERAVDTFTGSEFRSSGLLGMLLG